MITLLRQISIGSKFIGVTEDENAVHFFKLEFPQHSGTLTLSTDSEQKSLELAEVVVIGKSK